MLGNDIRQPVDRAALVQFLTHVRLVYVGPVSGTSAMLLKLAFERYGGPYKSQCINGAPRSLSKALPIRPC